MGQPDPIGLAGGINLFRYPADPSGDVDPSGERDPYKPDPFITPDQRTAMLREARSRFLERQELVEGRQSLQTPLNAKKCMTVAEEANQKGIASTPVGIGHSKPLVGNTLDYNTGAQGKMIWDDHYVNIDPKNPHGLVDMDQGFVWNSRQEMVNAMFQHPVRVGA